MNNDYMRILQYSFFSLLFFLIGTIVLFLLAQEILMFWGTNSLRGAISEMRKAQVTDICQTYLNQYSEEGISVGYQVKFISNSEFVTEAFCRPFGSNNRVLKSYDLPPFVTKIPGSSGIMYDVERSGLGLTVFANVYDFIKSNLKLDLSILQKEKYISVEMQTVLTESTFTSYGTTPRAACEGFGYTCCNSVTEVGAGQQATHTTNCERSCFSSCLRRPAILSFTSEPYPDPETRVVRVSAGLPVAFYYQSDVAKPDTGQASIDFGDGTMEAGPVNTGEIQHVYQCAQRSCQYTARLQLTDQSGFTSAETALSVLTIVVTP